MRNAYSNLPERQMRRRHRTGTSVRGRSLCLKKTASHGRFQYLIVWFAYVHVAKGSSLDNGGRQIKARPIPIDCIWENQVRVSPKTSSRPLCIPSQRRYRIRVLEKNRIMYKRVIYETKQIAMSRFSDIQAPTHHANAHACLELLPISDVGSWILEKQAGL